MNPASVSGSNYSMTVISSDYIGLNKILSGNHISSTTTRKLSTTYIILHCSTNYESVLFEEQKKQ